MAIESNFLRVLDVVRPYLYFVSLLTASAMTLVFITRDSISSERDPVLSIAIMAPWVVAVVTYVLRQPWFTTAALGVGAVIGAFSLDFSRVNSEATIAMWALAFVMSILSVRDFVTWSTRLGRNTVIAFAAWTAYACLTRFAVSGDPLEYLGGFFDVTNQLNLMTYGLFAAGIAMLARRPVFSLAVALVVGLHDLIRQIVNLVLLGDNISLLVAVQVVLITPLFAGALGVGAYLLVRNELYESEDREAAEAT